MKLRKILALMLAVAMVFAVAAACADDYVPTTQPEAPAPEPDAPAPEPEAPTPEDENGEDEVVVERTHPPYPITIGATPVLSGPFTLLGQAGLNGIILALEWEDRVDDFNLVVEDSQANAEIAITVNELLRTRDDARIIIGTVTGGEGLASAVWMQDHDDILYMPLYSAPQDITMREWSPGIVRAGFTGNQTTFHFGRYVAQEMGIQDLVIIGANYAFPHSQAAGFTRGFLENGGNSVERVWYPFGTLEFDPFMAQLIDLSRTHEAVLIVDGGASVLAFLAAWEAFGMDEFYDTLLGGTNIAFPFVLEQVPREFEGLISATHYWYANPDPTNQEFVNRFVERFGLLPDPVAVQGFDTMRAIIRALEIIDWDYQNTELLVSTVAGLRMDDSPRGPFTFCDRQSAVQDVYLTIMVWDEANNIMTTELIQRFPQVTQFGPFDGWEAEYMAGPIDGPDYPPGNREAYFAELRNWFPDSFVDNLMANGW